MAAPFLNVWNRLSRQSPLQLTTATGKPLIANVGESSIRFQTPDDRQVRPVGRARFEKWYHLWFVEGKRENKYFRNETGKKSEAKNFRYVKQLFELIALGERKSGEDQQAAEYSIPENGALPERVEATVSRIVRDTPQIRRLKNLYLHKCQLCGFSFQYSGGKRYGEGHHIKPLGKDHNGPDSSDNIIVVCPNHHAMLDYGAIRLSINEIHCDRSHIINPEYIKYHNSQIYSPPHS